MGRQEAAMKLNGKLAEHARRSRSTARANVVKTDPLTLLLEDNDLELVVGEDFDLTAWMKFYDNTYVIDVDETVLVHREGDHWSVFDVLTDKAI